MVGRPNCRLRGYDFAMSWISNAIAAIGHESVLDLRTGCVVGVYCNRMRLVIVAEDPVQVTALAQRTLAVAGRRGGGLRLQTAFGDGVFDAVGQLRAGPGACGVLSGCT